MSNIARYKKKGGFVQLLQLVETSGVAKQEKFISLIEAESPLWAKAVREKMLTIEKIMNASDEALKEIFSKIKSINIAAASFGFGQDNLEKIIPHLDPKTRREVVDYVESHTPNESEITQAYIKIFAEVRRLFDLNRYFMDKVDSSLKMDEDFENRLLSSSEPIKTQEPLSVVESKSASQNNIDLDDEILRLRKIVRDLKNEMDRLKVQNMDMRAKLDKITKLVA